VFSQWRRLWVHLLDWIWAIQVGVIMVGLTSLALWLISSANQ
jgi:hypothetical protein